MTNDSVSVDYKINNKGALFMKIKRKPPAPVNAGLYTVGHSNHPIQTFIEILESVGIDCLIDVRSRPQSRFCPHFNRNALRSSLRSVEVDYLWAGKHLGGLEKISVFDTKFIEKMDKVLELSRDKKVALMCSEGKPEECHRAMKLTAWVHRNTDINPTHITKGKLWDSREFESRMSDNWLWTEYSDIPF